MPPVKQLLATNTATANASSNGTEEAKKMQRFGFPTTLLSSRMVPIPNLLQRAKTGNYTRQDKPDETGTNE